MNKFFVSCLFLSLTSCCTLSLTNVCTNGEAEDVIDQEQKQDGEGSLQASIPAL